MGARKIEFHSVGVGLEGLTSELEPVLTVIGAPGGVNGRIYMNYTGRARRKIVKSPA